MGEVVEALVESFEQRGGLLVGFACLGELCEGAFQCFEAHQGDTVASEGVVV